MKIALRVLLVLTVLGGSAAVAQDRAPQPEHRGPYLALGDSIPLGYNPFLAGLVEGEVTLPLTTPIPDLLLSVSNYPEDVAGLLNLDLTNASCPGQTSDSFLALVPLALDNGCEEWRGDNLPLFVTYTSAPWETQEQYALSFLAAHRDTSLITITIGGNDLLILEQGCGGSNSCVQAGLPGVLLTLTSNLTDIYGAIRSAGYDGPIVAANYASYDYANAGTTGAVSAVNSAISTVTETFHGKVADVFSAFKLASGTEGLPCAVGLSFYPFPPAAGCDVHQTPVGQLAIAKLVLGTLTEGHPPVELSQSYENH